VFLVHLIHPIQRLFHIATGVGKHLQEKRQQLLERCAVIDRGNVVGKAVTAHVRKVTPTEGEVFAKGLRTTTPPGSPEALQNRRGRLLEYHTLGTATAIGLRNAHLIDPGGKAIEVHGTVGNIASAQATVAHHVASGVEHFDAANFGIT